MLPLLASFHPAVGKRNSACPVLLFNMKHTIGADHQMVKFPGGAFGADRSAIQHPVVAAGLLQLAVNGYSAFRRCFVLGAFLAENHLVQHIQHR
ncbi:hypothetical protein D3C76_1482310 [compost metagenome]